MHAKVSIRSSVWTVVGTYAWRDGGCRRNVSSRSRPLLGKFEINPGYVRLSLKPDLVYMDKILFTLTEVYTVSRGLDYHQPIIQIRKLRPTPSQRLSLLS